MKTLTIPYMKSKTSFTKTSFLCNILHYLIFHSDVSEHRYYCTSLNSNWLITSNNEKLTAQHTIHWIQFFLMNLWTHHRSHMVFNPLCLYIVTVIAPLWPRQLFMHYTYNEDFIWSSNEDLWILSWDVMETIEYDNVRKSCTVRHDLWGINITA